MKTLNRHCICAEERIRYSVSTHECCERKDMNRSTGKKKSRWTERRILRDVENVPVKGTFCIILHISTTFIPSWPCEIIFGSIAWAFIASESTFDTSLPASFLPAWPPRLYTNDAIEVGKKGYKPHWLLHVIYMLMRHNLDTDVEQDWCSSADCSPWKSTNATDAECIHGKSRKQHVAGQ